MGSTFGHPGVSARCPPWTPRLDTQNGHPPPQRPSRRFEWYDFYLYATLAPFFAALFFPPGNDTAALLSAFATYAAGFLTIMKPVGLGFVAIDMALATEDNQPPGNRHADPPHHHREH
jgi:hypothetical protein